MLMKPLVIYILALYSWQGSFSQNQKLIQKSWIKTEIINLSNRIVEADTLYTRYTFDRSGLLISFYPAWDSYRQDWSVSENNLTIGFDTHKIEELTDTSLTIALEGFRRMKFLAEDYLNWQEKNLVRIGDFNGKPLYKANDYITPRYLKNKSFSDYMHKSVEKYDINTATFFQVTFIVTEEGKIENIEIVQGIRENYNNDIIKQLLKSSKDWKPARFQGKPVQTKLSFEIKYLNSIAPQHRRPFN